MFLKFPLLFISALIFIISFFILWVWYHIFSSLLRQKFRLLIWYFFFVNICKNEICFVLDADHKLWPFWLNTMSLNISADIFRFHAYLPDICIIPTAFRWVLFIDVSFPCFYFLFIFREREGKEKEKERKIDVREKHQLVAFHTCPNQTEPATQTCALTGKWTHNLLVCRTTPS